jgi:hypothetical protein
MSIRALQWKPFPSGKSQAAGIVGDEVATAGQFQDVAIFNVTRTLERQSPHSSHGRTGISLIASAASFRRSQETPMTGDYVLRPGTGRERKQSHGSVDPTRIRPALPPRLITAMRQRSKHPARMPSVAVPLMAPGENF